MALHRGSQVINALIVTAALLGFIAGAFGSRPQTWWFVSFTLVFAVLLVGSLWLRWLRERVIRERPLPQFLKRKLRETYPHLSGRDGDLVERAFRQFFIACWRSKKAFVAMPSRGVDAYWHEFILHTSAYREWCELTLGRFLDHTPAEALGPSASTNDGLRRAWFWSCREEAIAPRKPSRLPLLFAIDAKLQIPNGYLYTADCRGFADGRSPGSAAQNGNGSYCGTDFGADGFAGDAGQMGGAESADGGGDFGGGDSGDGGGDGGGDGCGGGGD